MIYQPFRVWLTNWQTKICLLYIFLGDCDYHDYARRWWSKGWRTRTTRTGPGLGKTNWEWIPWSWSGGESFLARPDFLYGNIAFFQANNLYCRHLDKVKLQEDFTKALTNQTSWTIPFYDWRTSISFAKVTMFLMRINCPSCANLPFWRMTIVGESVQ